MLFLTANICPFLNIVRFLKLVLKILAAQNDFEDVESNFSETLNVQKELFRNEQK